MLISTIVAQKGGVSKTTTAATLAAALAERGSRILCIDLNEQADLTDTLAAAEGTGGSLELFAGTPAAELIRPTANKNIDVIAGADNLATLEAVVSKASKGKAFILRAALKPIRRKYDYCIIDAPGAFNSAFLNALAAADSLIIPAQADYYSLKNIPTLIKNIRYVKSELNPGLSVDGILLTRYQGRRNISKTAVETLEAAREALETRVFKTKIRENSKIAEAPGHRQSVLTYAPSSNGAKDYRAFIEEYMEILQGRK